MKKIVVFGASGDTGQYFVKYFLEHYTGDEYEIIATGTRETNYFNQFKVSYYQVDITKKDEFSKLPKDVYAVVDLAGAMPARMQGYDPYKYINVNITGNLNILEYCRENGVDRILFAQSFGDIKDYGEDQFAKNIAKHIVRMRNEIGRITTTGQLVEAVKAAIPMKFRATGGHPAKQTFQAIRIEVNKELDVLKDSIDDMIELLNDGGRLSIITFHSLEDRIVKNGFKKNVDVCTCPPNFPVCVCGNKPKGVIITRKPIVPTDEELEINKRAKSSKLRVFERRRED